MKGDLHTLGWIKFPFDTKLFQWVEAVKPIAFAVADDPDPQWVRHGATWYAGVNALPNNSDGSLENIGPLSGRTIDTIGNLGFGSFVWDPAQISICHRGYPKQDPTESDANHRFRKIRDAAHVDGVLPEGPNRRRHLRERHAFILGLPMIETPAKAAPFVIWEGSHRIIQAAFAKAFSKLGADDWGNIDITEIYQDARKQVWANCPRRELTAKPGEAYLAHRLSLHGVAPWPDDLNGPTKGRPILYFRPDTPDTPQDWLTKP